MPPIPVPIRAKESTGWAESRESQESGGWLGSVESEQFRELVESVLQMHPERMRRLRRDDPGIIRMKTRRGAAHDARKHFHHLTPRRAFRSNSRCRTR